MVAVVVSGHGGENASAAPSGLLEVDFDVRSDGGFDWARSGPCTYSSTVNAAQTCSGTSGIFDGGIFRGNTTPPIRPNQVAFPPALVDAAFIVDPLDIDTTACGTGDPTVFTGQGGEKNGDAFASMTFGTASVPPKDEISNVYAAAVDTGGSINGAEEIYFGAERIVNNGSSHIDLEFLQSTVTRTNACSGSFVGRPHAGRPAARRRLRQRWCEPGLQPLRMALQRGSRRPTGRRNGL